MSAVLSLVLAVLASAGGVAAGTPKACPLGGLSCQNTLPLDRCCFNSPGGQLLLTQFWDTAPVTGPVDSWTMHGLWPDKCDGTHEQNCDPSREYSGVRSAIQASGETALLSDMDKYWKDYKGNDEQFWSHEWNKHGTCISTLEKQCYTSFTPKEEMVDYFQIAIDLFKTRSTYSILAAAGITPSSSKTYSAASIQSALAAAHGSAVTIRCDGSTLNEVWYHYNVRGSVQTGQFVAAAPDGVKGDCPGNVSYKPKTGRGSTPTTTAQPPAATGSFRGSGFLTASTGCLISAGTWYSTGTCAIFTATASGSGFKLTSSKGPCGISGGRFVCSSSATAAVFTAVGGKLAYLGASTWYAAAVPAGSTQQNVYTSSASGRATAVTFGWGS